MLAAAAIAALGTAQAWSDTANSARDVPHVVIELRQYTLRPGKRDVLIGLFDRYFVDGQEQQGIRVVGQFRDLGDEDRFVWIHSFADMQARAAALAAFHYGPVWQSHREAANATMVDSDNVFLLKPASPESAFAISGKRRPAADVSGPGRGVVVASIVYLRRSAPGQFADFFHGEIKAQLQIAGASIIAELVTDDSANSFPRLPVREGERAFVWFSTFPDTAAYDAHRRALAGSSEWRESAGRLSQWTHQPIETLLLEPTARSMLQGGNGRL